MIEALSNKGAGRNQLGSLLIILAVLGAAGALGLMASPRWIIILLAPVGALLLLWRPSLGLELLVVAALLVPVSLGTGTEVRLYPVVLLVPALLALWLLKTIVQRDRRRPRSRTFVPLFLFLVAGLLSLLIGNATWDPIVPRNPNFLLVQLAQWAIFALSAAAFWLTASLVQDETRLQRLTWLFLLLGGVLAISSIIPGGPNFVRRISTGALTRAPFWMLLSAMAGGQLLYDRQLSGWKRLFLLIVLAAVLVFAFFIQRENLSIWIGVLVALITLGWLRFRRLHWLFLVLLVALVLLGNLLPAAYEFAGGDAEWRLSGATRIVLSRRVIDVTMRNPITGLGPASYRAYTALQPLNYGNNQVWYNAVISSHNNYVDLFSHVGVVGLTLLFWLVLELARLGRRLCKQAYSGFQAGYINGILAALAGALVIMVFGDWILPFVYNIGFHGFQASVLVWLFLGGLVALEQMPDDLGGKPDV